MLILCLARNLVFYANTCGSGIWPFYNQEMRHFDIRGKTLGLIGLGNTASALAIKADSLGMKVIGYNPRAVEKRKHTHCQVIYSFKEFLEKADFVSIHVPFSAQTKNLISKKELLMMKKGSFIINTA